MRIYDGLNDRSHSDFQYINAKYFTLMDITLRKESTRFLTRNLLYLVLLLNPWSMSGQFFFTEVHSVWDDRLDEWEILAIDEAENEEVVIRLSMIWPLSQNWNEWRIDSDQINGTMKTKWRDDPSQWELRTDSSVVTIRQVNRYDPGRWEVREGNSRVLLSTRYRGVGNEWIIPRQIDQWYMYAEFPNDVRDWIIEDYLDHRFSAVFRLSLIFIALWQTLPK